MVPTDGSRAKSILIVAFLALDLFLGWQLLQENHAEEAAGLAASGPNPTSIRRGLLLSGIRFDGAPPDAPVAMSLLRVAYADPDRAALVSEMIPPGATVQHASGESGTETWSWGRERLFILDGAFVFYLRGGPSTCPAPDLDSARRVADTFLATRMGGLPPGSTFDLAQVEPDESCRVGVYYRQQYNAFPIWGRVGADPEPVSGPFKVDVDRNGVVSVVERVLAPQGFSGSPEPIVRWDAALTHLYQVLPRNGGLHVRDIRVGYFSDVYCPVRSYEIPPVWQVRLEGGEVYYVNAHTGEVEGARSPACSGQAEGSQ